MYTFDYNPLADILMISYVCPICSKINNEYITVPLPDLTAETDRESINTDIISVQCEHCEKEFNIELATGYNGGIGKIYDVENVINIEEDFPDMGDCNN